MEREKWGKSERGIERDTECEPKVVVLVSESDGSGGVSLPSLSVSLHVCCL